MDDNLTARDRAHLSALESTFPGWAIRVNDGAWTATRLAPTTPAQRAAGVEATFTRAGPLELSAALAQQVGVLSRLGAGRTVFEAPREPGTSGIVVWEI